MSQAVKTTVEGIPMMRSMVLEFPEDSSAQTLDRQYMLGDNLLVAPIFNDRGEVDFYVPEGRWTNYLTNEVLEGGRWYHEVHDYMTLPLLARPDSIIIEGSVDNQAEYDYEKDIIVHIFELSDGRSAETRVYDKLGLEIGKVVVERTDDILTVSTEGTNGVKVLLHNIESVQSVNGGKEESSDRGTLIGLEKAKVEIKL